MQFHVDKKFQFEVFLISLILLFIQLKPVEDAFLDACLVFYSKGILYILFCGAVIILSLTALHESIHGFFYIIFGAEIKLGFMGINPYIIDVSKKHFSMAQYGFIILSPLIFISLFSLFLNYVVGSLIFYLNLFASSGDILLFLSLASYSKNSEFEDQNYGYKVYEK